MSSKYIKEYHDIIILKKKPTKSNEDIRIKFLISATLEYEGIFLQLSWIQLLSKHAPI